MQNPLPILLPALLTSLFAISATTAKSIPMPVVTPLPSAVAGVASPTVSLNGNWEFAAADDATFKSIRVPGEWAMQGFSVKPATYATYRRIFDLPADWVDKTIKLRFDAVHAVCKVSVNGKETGAHEGGFVPFEIDVTGAAKPGRNELTVKVQSESIADSIACVSQYASHQVGGIVRKVTLFCVPETHVSELWHETRLSGKDALLKVHTSLTGSLKEQANLTHRLLDHAGKPVATTHGDGSLHVPHARLWTSETPYLYTLETTTPGQTLRQAIGLREIKVQGAQLLVNGQPVKLSGINRHEAHPLLGRSLTPELCRRDAELFRAANVNLVRTSHYPPSEEFLTACDELGIFVECEAAVCWIKHHASPVWKTWNHLDPQYLPYFLRSNLDNIAANRNHPSVIIWSIANESLWSPLFADVLAAVKHADPSRPTAFHDQCWGGFNNAGSKADIAVYHYPTDHHPDEWSKLDRPVWFGEYAHLQAYNRRELVTDPGIRADWGRPLASMVDLIWQQPGCLGGAIWSGIDDVFHMPDGNLKGYGHWGIIDGWRREKPEYQGVFHAYSPIRILESKRPAGNTRTLRVQNRFNFTNLSEISLEWKSGGKSGTIKADIAPHETGDIQVPFMSELVLTATDLRGVRVAEFTLFPQAGTEGIHNSGALRKIAVTGGSIDLTSTAALRIPPPIPVVIPLNSEGGAEGPAGSVLTNEIEPFSPLPETWRPAMTLHANGAVELTGESEQMIGTISIEPTNTSLESGGFTVRYEMRMKQDVNPRQWGLVFTLPRMFDTLKWNSKADDMSYGADHIARPSGTAKANPVIRRQTEEPGVEPKTAWRLDANASGSADFRSTKSNIRAAALQSPDKQFAVSFPTQPGSVRAWVDGKDIRLLVTGFNTGGSDPFFASHYAAERRPLKTGDVIRSSFEIEPAPIP